MIKQFIRTFTDLTVSHTTCSRDFLMLITTNDTRNILFILLRFKHFAKILLHTINYPPKILESFTFFAYFLILTHFSFCFHTLKTPMKIGVFHYIMFFLMPKMTYTSKNHGQAIFVSCFDRFLVTNRATRLDDSLDTSLSNFFHIIRKWKESI